MLDTVDPYIPLYTFEKTEHPEKRMVWKQYRRRDVDDVDRIIELSKGERDTVRTLDDWRVVHILLDFFSKRWPTEFEEFKKSVPDIRSSRNNKGYSKTKEIQYVGALPQRFMRLVKVIFPYQQFDKKFVNLLVKKIPLFKVAGEGN